MSKCESRMAIRILGQNLTTEVKSGSLAAARVHENVKLEIIQFDDRTLNEHLRDQVLRPYCQFNFPAGAQLAPRISRQTAPTEDRKNEADTASSAATALTALLQAGVPVDIRAYAKRYGIPLTEPNPEGDALPQPAQPAAPAAQSPPTDDHKSARKDAA